MQLWTTPKLRELVLEDGLPVTLKAEQDIRESYLRDAGLTDAAILPIDDEYMDVLVKSSERGLRGPILFISPEPVIEQQDHRYSNALILDLKRMGLATVREIVMFIIRLALERVSADPRSLYPVSADQGEAKEIPWETNIDIPATLSSLLTDNSRLIVTFQIRDNNELVTARGSCFIKTLSENAIVLNRIKPVTLINGIRPETEVSLLFSRGDHQFHTILKKPHRGNDEIVASIPDRIFFVRRRFLRIEPSPPWPVYISVLLPNERTEQYKVLELSQRGCSFIGPGKFEQGKAYACTIMLPEPTALLHIYGIMRSKKEYSNRFRYGVELQIHHGDEDTIAQYIMQRELQILSLLR